MGILDVNTAFGFYPYRKLDTSLETLKGILGNYNARAFSLSLKGVFYDAREGNEETLNLIGRDNIYPVATYDPRAYPRDIEYLEDLISRGFLAIAFFPRMQGWTVDFAPFRMVLDIIEAESFPVVIHTGGYGEITKISILAEEIENPVIISGTGYSNLSEAIAVAQEVDNIYIETHLLNSPDALEFCRRYIGIERFVFGSGTPILSFETAYNVVEKSSLSDDDKEMIFYKNLEDLVGVRL